LGRVVIWLGTGAAATGVGLPLGAAIAGVVGLSALCVWIGNGIKR